MAYVLKVKYEGNLRRLTIKKDEIESGAFIFTHLEQRIRELFELPASNPLVITYTDVENDDVTMGDDSDLKDALIEQSLNPLRIHVTLSKVKPDEKAQTGEAKDSDNPFPYDMRRMLHDHAFCSRLEFMKEACQSYQPLVEGVKSTAQIPALLEALQGVATQLTSAVKNGVAAATAAAAATSEQRPGACPRESKESTVPQGGVDFGCKSDVAAGAEPGSSLPSAEPLLRKDRSPPPAPVHYGITCDHCGVVPIVGSRWKSLVKFDFDLCQSCYENVMNSEDYTKIDVRMRPRRMHGRHRFDGPPGFPPMAPPPPPPPPPPHGMAPACHTNVPGPLRSVLGNRIPFISDPRPKFLIPEFGLSPPLDYSGSPPMGLFQSPGPRSFGMRGSEGHPVAPSNLWSPAAGNKLYARFVCDVTVFDGTEMAPGTHFVKIWRLRNAGTAPWPVDTRLIFAGGDQLGDLVSVPLEIPPQGLAPQAELEVSVDMVAPEKLGRYVSHWRLRPPVGPKFGQRLTAVIQVVPKAALDGTIGDNLSVPEEARSSAGLNSPGEPVDGQVDKEFELSRTFSWPVEGVKGAAGTKPGFSSPADFSDGSDFYKLFELMKASNPYREEELVSGTNSEMSVELLRTSSWENVGEDSTPESGLLTGEKDNTSASETQVGTSKSTAETLVVTSESSEDGISAAASQAISAEKIEDPITYPKVVEVAENDSKAKAVEPAVDGEDSGTTKALLAKLESMGFTDTNLNVEVLRKNSFNLRKTLDDLCAAEDWDPILEELEEMGFFDSSMNRRLLFKNNGSVKRVVKELVQLYRAAEN